MRWIGRMVRGCVMATVVAAAAAVFAAQATASVSLATSSISLFPQPINAVAVGDLNGDGVPDLAVASGNSAGNTATVTILVGNGAGGFTAQTPIHVGLTNAQLDGIAIGDLNGDGRPDIVVSDDTHSQVWVLPNTTAPGASTPTFGTAVSFGAGTTPAGVAIGDMNEDGRNDIVVANSGSNNVSVLLNTTTPGTSTPSFATQQTFNVGTNPIGIAMGDLNRDGRPDIVTANQGGTGISVLLNTTAQDGTTAAFAPHEDVATGTFPYAVAVGDLNGDGIPDIAVANNGDGNVSVLAGDGDGQFSAPHDYSAGTGPDTIAIGDLNGDGHPDLVVGNHDSHNVSVLSGNGRGAFGAPSDFGLGSAFAQPTSLAVADLNGDGADDVVTVNNTTLTVSVLLNQAVISSPGSLAFGSQTTGQAGPVSWLPVTDTGGAPLTFTGNATITGADAAEFTIPSGYDGCANATVARGGVCWIGVQFTAAATGARTATLAFAAANVNSPAPSVALTGTGVAPNSGPAGQNGTPGKTGATGPAGPAGKPGEIELVTCSKKSVVVRRRRKSVQSCTTKLVSKPVKFKTALATLSRSGHVVASGVLSNGRLHLNSRRALSAGRYLLTLRAGRRTVRLTIRI